jgi:hypothetical protein
MNRGRPQKHAFFTSNSATRPASKNKELALRRSEDSGQNKLRTSSLELAQSILVTDGLDLPSIDFGRTNSLIGLGEDHSP